MNGFRGCALLVFFVLSIRFFLSCLKGGFEVLYPFPKSFAELRYLVDPEDEDDDHKNYQKLGHAERAEHIYLPLT